MHYAQAYGLDSCTDESNLKKCPDANNLYVLPVFGAHALTSRFFSLPPSRKGLESAARRWHAHF